MATPRGDRHGQVKQAQARQARKEDGPPAGLATPAAAEGTVYDVVVYGGTSAGVTAGVQAARMVESVVLIEPTSYLGGLTSGGLGMTDTGNREVIGGVSREFYRRIRKHYESDAAWTAEKEAR